MGHEQSWTSDVAHHLYKEHYLSSILGTRGQSPLKLYDFEQNDASITLKLNTWNTKAH